jgi:hypothetical protein
VIQLRPKNKRYGQWAGDPKGRPEDPERCVAEVADNVSNLFHQCSRYRGHGPGAVWCKQHAKMAEKG